jgi:predicted DNA-binding protein
MPGVRLDPLLEKRLERLAAKTGRTKSTCRGRRKA